MNAKLKEGAAACQKGCGSFFYKPVQPVRKKGGLYASAVCIDGDDGNIVKVENKILKWLEGTNFILDRERDIMGNMTYNDKEIKKGLGYEQPN